MKSESNRKALINMTNCVLLKVFSRSCYASDGSGLKVDTLVLVHLVTPTLDTRVWNWKRESSELSFFLVRYYSFCKHFSLSFTFFSLFCSQHRPLTVLITVKRLTRRIREPALRQRHRVRLRDEFAFLRCFSSFKCKFKHIFSINSPDWQKIASNCNHMRMQFD